MKTCGVCDDKAEGHYAIHRYAMGVGPEIYLCDSCGELPIPTCDQIWRCLSSKRLPRSAFLKKSKKRKARKRT